MRLDGLSERARRFLNKRLSFRECFLTPGGDLTTAGAAVMRHLARKAQMFNEVSHRSPITGVIDPLAMARAEGRRDIYRYLQTMLELPDRAILESMEDE